MSSLDTPPTKLGLRERKKQQTREKIARVALELFAERGYDETTLAEIADAADVAPRTIFAYFESKDDILLCEEVSFLGELKRQLDERPAGTTTVDTLREFLSHIEAPDEAAQLRKRVMTANPALKRKMRASHGELEPMLAESIAKDLGAAPRRHPPAPDRRFDDRRVHLDARPVHGGGRGRRADDPRAGHGDPRPGTRLPARRPRGHAARLSYSYSTPRPLTGKTRSVCRTNSDRSMEAVSQDALADGRVDRLAGAGGHCRYRSGQQRFD